MKFSMFDKDGEMKRWFNKYLKEKFMDTAMSGP